MKRFVTALCMVLLVLSLVLTASPEYAAALHTDARSSAAQTEKLIVRDGLTRGEWMYDLTQLFALESPEEDYPDVYFPDLLPETEYFDAVMVAVKYGLVPIEAGESFEPEAPLTRAFAAQTAVFALGLQSNAAEPTYSDADAVPCGDEAQAAVEQGWFALVEGRFAPDEPVSAAELERILETIETVLDERTIEESIADIELADFVTVLPGTVEPLLSFDPDSDLVIVTIEGWEGTLSPGDTFAVYSDDFPLVYGVDRVERTDGALRVFTTDAPEGAVLRLDYAGSTELTVEPVQAYDEPVTLMSADGAAVTFEPARISGGGKGPTHFSIPFSMQGSPVQGSLSGELSDLKLEKKFLGAKRYFVLSGNLKVDASMELDFLGGSQNQSIPLLGVDVLGVGYIGLSLNLKMAATFGYSFEGSFRVGLDTRGGYHDWIHELNRKDSCIHAKGDVSAMLSLSARLDFGACGGANVGLTVGPIAHLGYKEYSDGNPRKCQTISGYLYAGATAHAKLKDPILGYVVFDKSFDRDFYNQTNSPTRIQIHLEDDYPVSACTRGKDSGWEFNGYYAPKYTTPVNSRAWAGGSHVSSSGYGGYGSTEPVVIWETEDNGDGAVTITAYHGSASVLNIPESIDGKTVTGVGNNVFHNNKQLRIVYVPEGVDTIGWYAFEGCSALTKISLPTSLREIESKAFRNCTSLKEISLPEGLETITSGAFENCSSLSEVSIPGSLQEYKPGSSGTYLDWTGVFSGCSSLNSVHFNETVSIIVDFLFRGCSGLTHIEIPDTVTVIGVDAFEACSNLGTVQAGDNLTEIGGRAFSNCINLETVLLKDCLNIIGERVFENCAKLQTVRLSPGMTEIPYAMFCGCTSLKSITLPDAVTKLGESAFADCKHLETFIAPNDLLIIGEACFQNCAALTEVNLNEGLRSIGREAFQGCGALVRIVLPETVTELGSTCFQKCAKLSEVTLSPRLTAIPSYAFANCTALTSIVIPKDVTVIEDNAFYQDTKLYDLTLPASVTSIGGNAFSYPRSTTVRGVAGSYAETFAKWKEFIDVTLPAEGLALVSGKDSMTVQRWTTFFPAFTMDPAASTDLVSLVSDNPEIVRVKEDGGLYAVNHGTATVTATASGGAELRFTVTVSDRTGIEVTALPEKTVYALGERKALRGLTVCAIFSNGDREPIEDYILSGFDTWRVGEKTIAVRSGNDETAFQITVTRDATGTLGKQDELSWSYSGESGTLTVTGIALSETEPVYGAVYDQNGRMTNLVKLVRSGERVELGTEFASVKLLWLDIDSAPKCEAAEF